MSTENDVEKKLLAHHEQLPLCTTRLSYRQGRKLTAVKVYTVNSESNHLLVFGVPSLNLRQEAKALFIKFGKLIIFTVTTDHPAEAFTETYHVKYERIQSARIAKKMIDTKNFYGGSLHICYAPELESVEETRTKLLQRKNNVLYRLTNLQKDAAEPNKSKNQIDISNDKMNIHNPYQSHEITPITNELTCSTGESASFNEGNINRKMNMGEQNIIYLNKNKRKNKGVVIEKRFKPSFDKVEVKVKDSVDIVDCTSVDKDVVSNINDGLNYNKFGNEVIKKVDVKPMNRIVFKCNKKS